MRDRPAGSLSVLLPDGSAFVGDLAFNVFPWGGPIFPPFADNVPRLLESWKLLLARGITTIYPGHGKPSDRSFPDGYAGWRFKLYKPNDRTTSRSSHGWS